MNIPRLPLRSSSLCLIGTLLSLGSAFGQTEDTTGKSPAVTPTGLRQAAPADGPKAGASADAPKTETPRAGALITKEWRVRAELIPPIPPDPTSALKPSGAGIADRESAKRWLIDKGIVFQGQAAAVYIVRSSRLIVRNTQDQIDLIDALIARESAAYVPAPEKNAAAPEKDAAGPGKDGSDPVIPKIELRDATPAEAFQTITVATGIKVFYAPAPGAPEARITISLTNVPTSEALRYITSLAGLNFSIAKDGIHIEAK